MNLNQLYYFKELAKERQFSKAAKNLYISQPSLSNSIKSLEKELNCQLINRNGGQITLTEYGKIFCEAAITSINSIEKSKIDIANCKRKEENIIKIAAHQYKIGGTDIHVMFQLGHFHCLFYL